MADYTKNITNAVNVFGNGPSTKWGQATFPCTMTWGTAKWGEGRPMEFQVVKYVTNTQDSTWNYTSSQFQKSFEIGSAALGNDMSSEGLTQGNWNYVFTSNETEAEDRAIATWTQVANPDATFTCQAAGSTSWSEV